MTTTRGFGEQLRSWRQHRRLSQMELAHETGVSTRHLSFVETGRSRPSSEMILRLAEHLDVPLAERNVMLLAAGHAPAYPDHDWDDAELTSVRTAATRIINAHHPNPAVIVDHHWNLVAANRAVDLLTAGADPALLTPPVNVLRLSLHPAGMAPRILNLPEWRAHLLDRLRRQITTTRDPALQDLHAELTTYPGDGDEALRPDPDPRIVVPLHYRHPTQDLTLISTTTIFGAPKDVTVAGLAIETFLPEDEATAKALQALA